MKSFIALIILGLAALATASCSSDEPQNKYPKRGGSSELPWDKPASWEGGLPGMGGIGNTPRY